MKQLAILLSLAFLFTSCDSILSPESGTPDKSQQLSPQLMQSSQQSGQGHWKRQGSGTDNDFNSVYFIDDQTGWAVGAYKNAIIKHTTDGGETWRQQESGTSSNLRAVYFVDEQTGWTVGKFGVILHTTDGGETWYNQVPEQSGRLTDNDLNAVQFIDSQTGWAVGEDGIILHTTNGGQTWQKQDERPGSRLEDVQFLNSQTGWAVGRVFTGAPPEEGLRAQYNRLILRTTDGGETWQRKEGDDNTASLGSVYFIDGKNGWAVGGFGTILYSTDGGQTWRKQEIKKDWGLGSVHFVNAQIGWAVGFNGVILHTINGGQTWQKQESGTSSNLRSVYFVDAQNGWAVGSNDGIILNFSGEQEEPPPPEPASQTIYGEQLKDPWIDASWNASVNYSSSERARSGSKSIRVDQNPWGALSTRSGRWGDSKNLSPGQFKQVEFAVYAPEQSVRLDLRLQNSEGDDFPRVRHGTVEAGSWTIVSVSLAKLNPNDRSWNRLVVSESSGSAKTYFVDELRLTGEGEAPPPEDEPEAFTVYQDKLQDPWIDASWSAAVDYNNSERSHAGSRSIRVEQDPWGALSTRSGPWGDSQNIESGRYEQVKFAIYANESLTIDLLLENDQGDEFPRVRYGTVEAGSWTTVSVPLGELNPDGHPFNRIDIAESSGAARTYFVDDLQLTAGSSGPMAANTK